MIVEQIYTKCLAQGAYYIQSGDEAAVIDPLREATSYVEKARQRGASIKYIFETHFHADFVSGHVSLANKTGGKIVYGPEAKPIFDAYIARDNEDFRIGDIVIRLLHTPGHTMESSTYLLFDEQGKEQAIFTGDTLFLGDVGRPDLAQSNQINQEDLAALLYKSLREKIMPLPNDVKVYPGHGAGSACGKNMMKETVDTLGNQKKLNYALRKDMSSKEFVKEVLNGLLPPPAYFSMNVKINVEGYIDIDQVLDRGLQSYDSDEFERVATERGATVLDVRSPQNFLEGHIPNSLFIGLDGSFAPWVGELIVDVKCPILLVVDKGREEEAITRLARVGFDNTLGYLKGGIEAWKKSKRPTQKVSCIMANDLALSYDEVKENIVDVRNTQEFGLEHLKGVKNIPLRVLKDNISSFPRSQKTFIHCAGGYRSMIAISILQSEDFCKLVNVEGGFQALKNTTIPLSLQEI